MRKAKPPYQFGQQQQPDFAQTGPGGTFGADNSNGNFNGAASPALQPNRNAAGLGALGSAGLGDGMDPFAIPKIGQGLQALSKSLGGSQAAPGSPAPTLGSAQTGGLVGGGPSAAPTDSTRSGPDWSNNVWYGPMTTSMPGQQSGPYPGNPNMLNRSNVLNEINALDNKLSGGSSGLSPAGHAFQQPTNGVYPQGPDVLLGNGMGPDRQPAPKVSDNNFLPHTDTISAAPSLLNAPMQTRTVDGAAPPSLQLQKPVSRVNQVGPGAPGLRGLRMFQ